MTAADPDATAADGDEPSILLRKPVDWLVAVLLALVGLATAAGGLAFRAGADRETIRRMVREETIHSDVLTDAELVDATYQLVKWGGWGFAATGALLVVVGVAYAAYRSRVRDRPGGSPDTLTLAVLGATVTGVTSFVPFSPVVGGAVAGYLRDGSGADGATAGAAAGLAGLVPLVVLFAFLAAGMVAADLAVVVGVLGVALAVAALYLVAVSAIGGFVGVYVAEEF